MANDTKRNSNSKWKNQNRNSGGKNKKSKSTRSDGSDTNRKVSKNAGALDPLNDISWWANNPMLLASAAQIPFPYKPGMTVPNEVDVSDGTSITRIQKPLYLPGVIGIDFHYGIGYSSDVNSPASIVAKEMYSQIRNKFSGTLTADAPDIFMYVMALDMIHAFIAWNKRVYRVINRWSGLNHDYPDTVLQAMRLNPSLIEDIRNNLTEYWGQINTLVHQVNKFAVPDNMKIFTRHRWMNENIYLDEPTMAAQSYVFNPLSFYEIDDTTATGTSLKRVDFNLEDISEMSVLIETGRIMLQKLSDWEDAYTINGYLLRAYEGQPFYYAELLAQDEVILPVYVYEVLTQIENSRAVAGDGIVVDIPDITQDPTTNAVIWRPTADLAEGMVDPQIHINIHSDTPTVAEITEATRLTSFLYNPDERLSAQVICGTELVVNYRMVMKCEGYIETYPFASLMHVDENNLTSIAYNVWSYPLIVKNYWSHAPMVYWKIDHPVSGDNMILSCQLANLAPMTDDALRELHRVCMYSVFNCFNT